MVTKTRSKRGQRGSVMIFLTLALPLFVGLVGLAIDATLCYIVQTELSTAVDGAALGTGRLLSTNANPTDIANEFLNANFRVGDSGFWAAYNLTPTVTVTTGITKTVTVSAAVTVPLLFMRLLHQNSATVSATATATRRDARIEFVIDRSGSMKQTASDGNTVIYDVLQKAENFTEQFTSCPTTSCTTSLDYDELGLVAFSGSAVVGYPTTPWPSDLSPTGSGGPDIYFYNGATTDMVHQLANITAGDGTAMGDALALAYIELQKSHMRDVTAYGTDTRMNAIVLFTDGVPSSVVTYLNQTSDPNNVINSGSNCTYRKDTAGTHPIQGYVVVSGAPPYSGSPQGFYQLASLYPTESSATWMSDPTKDMSISAADSTVDIVPSAGLAGCNKTGGSSWGSMSNLSFIPSFDKYGHSLGALTTGGVAGYNFSSIVGDANATKINSSGNYDNTKPSQAYQWGLAGWNEVDNVANDIRNDSNHSARGESSAMPITIYTIGYTGTGGTDAGLLQKIANVYGCSVNGYSCVNATQKQGIYAQAANADEIANAFNTILTAILRLAR